MAEQDPAVRGVNRILHGGDYNPEQWEMYEGLWDEDMRLMKLAHVNNVSLGIFSWARLEPQEGRFDFGWMDRIIEKLHRNGQMINLATPSGAKPNWLALKYPEVRRVAPNGLRDPQAGRHNHCYTSPVYREKIAAMNTRLAERYGDHPAVIMWHISNEYGGACYCELCRQAFRGWLRRKYETVDAMNHAWWSRFWSHAYASFDEVEHIDSSVHGLVLDWKRFVTDQTLDFMRHEAEPLKRLAPRLPITINMMGLYGGLDYWRIAPHLDLVSWDSYPAWHAREDDIATACDIAFVHDVNRSMKQRPFVLMESTPSQTNWQAVSRPKRPGMHRLASLQAVAHGSDAVLYFQWRKSRGSSEKFHGAVVDHVGHENTRVFREVASLGQELESLGDAVGTMPDAQAAVIYDWQNAWAIEGAQGPRNQDRNYAATCQAHYRQLWRRGVSTDVIESTCDLSRYRLVIAPMLYMLRPGVAERLTQFVRGGGTLLATYLTGIADENDLVHLGGWPGGGLRELFGVWVEEQDVLHPHNAQAVEAVKDNALGLNGSYAAREYCDVTHAEGADVLATYGGDFYAGSPAVTMKSHGGGAAVYVASRNDERFLSEIVESLLKRSGVNGVMGGIAPLPEGISATRRGKRLFLMNFSTSPQQVDTPTGPVRLEPYGVRAIQDT